MGVTVSASLIFGYRMTKRIVEKFGTDGEIYLSDHVSDLNYVEEETSGFSDDSIYHFVHLKSKSHTVYNGEHERVYFAALEPNKYELAELKQVAKIFGIRGKPRWFLTSYYGH